MYIVHIKITLHIQVCVYCKENVPIHLLWAYTEFTHPTLHSKNNR